MNYQPDFAIVKIEEKDWNLSDMLEIEKVITCYLVDLNRLTYQCDSRPSCELVWLAYDPRYKDYSSVSNLRSEAIDTIISNEPGYDISRYKSDIATGKLDIVEIVKIGSEELKDKFTEYTNLEDDSEYRDLCEEVYDLVNFWGLYW